MKPVIPFVADGKKDPATDGRQAGDGKIDPPIGERLAGGAWFPPQGHPGSVDGVPRYNPFNYKEDTYHAAGAGLGRRIRGFRGLYDMSLAALAAQLNVPEATVDAWEKSQETPTVLQLCILCDVFKTTPNGLLMGPFYVQAGPLQGMGSHLETLPNDAQMAILFIARICYRGENKTPPHVF